MSMYFCYFLIISPWKRVRPFIWTNVNSIHPRMLCVKFGWNWLSGSGGEDILISSIYFSLFHSYLPLEKGGALHLYKLESPSTKDVLWQVWSKLTQWFRKRRFFNFINVFSPFRNYLPFEKGRALCLNKLESPSPKDALWQVWLKLAHWYWQRFFSTHWCWYRYPFNWENGIKNKRIGIFHQCTCNVKMISKEEKGRTRQDAFISLW